MGPLETAPLAAKRKRRAPVLISVAVCLTLAAGAVTAAIQRDERPSPAVVAARSPHIQALRPAPAAITAPRNPAEAAGTPKAVGDTGSAPSPPAPEPPVANAGAGPSSPLALQWAEPTVDSSVFTASGAAPAGEVAADADGQAAAGAGAGAPAAPTGAGPEEESGPRCGAVVCAVGQECCNASCGTCVSPGERCSQLLCGMQSTLAAVECGRNTCDVGETCCNPSCGICTAPGQSCSKEPCLGGLQYPDLQACGTITCSAGTYCCNPSCGTCVAPGEVCDSARCD